MSFEINPVKAVHSVGLCALIVRFVGKLTKQNLENIEKISSISVPNTKEHRVPAVKDKPLEFIFESLDSKTSLWEVYIYKDAITISCHEYTRWENFYKISEHILTKIFSSIPKKHLWGISLGVLDVFEVISEKSFSLQNLFKEDSEFITRAFINSELSPARSLCSFSNLYKGDHWEEYLNRISISAETNEESSFKFVIDHLSTIYSNKKMLAQDFYAKSTREIEDAIYFLHDENKKIIKSLLTDSVLERIGLKEKKYVDEN